ncbi:uncharacterized protein F4812DRAFT_347383 [Daldinia caldariorum]|uniref:uncharacterized protein n=1 Tax=Daldinia caldariorum TaxID=326644 RepID=UPI002008850B|nr:uncharacterized protein F4812DRAFT_347383 [Daldinia caldariorum]KAI1468800.1 hypothetical protein F4812DRAFT_347383 [Daldinia caldariorum]
MTDVDNWTQPTRGAVTKTKMLVCRESKTCKQAAAKRGIIRQCTASYTTFIWERTNPISWACWICHVVTITSEVFFFFFPLFAPPMREMDMTTDGKEGRKKLFCWRFWRNRRHRGHGFLLGINLTWGFPKKSNGRIKREKAKQLTRPNRDKPRIDAFNSPFPQAPRI